MSNLSDTETQRVQTILRKESEQISKHVIRTVPNLTGDKGIDGKTIGTPSEARIKARSLGHMKYIYYDEMLTSRLETESPTEHVRAMIMSAKKHVGPEVVGAPGEPAPLGGEEMPLAESKNISKDEITRLIIEEWTDAYLKDKIMKINKNTLRDMVMEELSKLPEQAAVLPPDPGPKKKKRGRRKEKVVGKTKSGRRIRKARRWAPIKKGKYPHNKFQVYSVTKVVDGKKAGDDKASFDKFYKAVLNSPEARRQLGCRGKGYKNCRRWRGGGMDYTWGDQHADAYATLNQGSRATGKVKVEPGTEKALKKGAEEKTPGFSHLTGVGKSHLDIKDPKAKAIYQYERWSQKAEKYKQMKIKVSDEMAKLRSKMDTLAKVPGGRGGAEYNSAADRHDALHKQWVRINDAVPKLEKLAQIKAKEAKGLDKPKEKAAAVDLRGGSGAAKLQPAMAQKIASNIKDYEEMLKQGTIPDERKADVQKEIARLRARLAKARGK